MRTNLGATAAALLGIFVGAVGAAEVGSTAGVFEVSSSGAATYSIPISVPPGTGGMKPTLSIGANSHGGAGLLGLQWAVSGISQITRCAAQFDQDGFFDGPDLQADSTVRGDDKFCLDGKRLIAVSGTYGRNNTEYRLELEDFSTAISYGGPSFNGVNPAYFKVWTKSGLVMEFGTTADSNWQGSTATYVWALARTTDSVGNYVEYRYSVNSTTGEILPSQILYTGNATTGLVPNASVTFVYEARPDIRFAYVNGKRVEDRSRLANIRTWVNGSLVRDYRLSYEALSANASKRSRLSQVEECAQGQTGLVCLPPTTVAWQKQTAAFAWGSLPSGFNPPYGFVGDGYGDIGGRLVDLNGDGRADFIYGRFVTALQRTDAGAYLNTANGWVSSPAYTPPYNLVADNVGDLGARFEDVNGDGLVDLIYHRYLPDGPTTLKGAYINTGSGWEERNEFAPPYHIVAHGMGDMGARFIDVNGDGLIDEVYSRQVSSGQITRGAWINNGHGWDSNASFAPPYPLAHESFPDLGGRFEDVNGDGLVDVVYNRYVTGDGSTRSGAFINSGTGWLGNAGYIPPYPMVADGFGELGARFEDVNGDGLVDLIYSRYTTGDGQTISGAYMNTGTGWSATSYANYTPPYHLKIDGLSDAGSRLEDVNGDGLVDLVVHRYINQSLSDVGAWLNNGDGWTRDDRYAPPYPISTDARGDAGVRFADVDGDGFVDVLQGRALDTGVTQRAGLANASVMEAFSTITTGLAAQVQVTYDALTNPLNPALHLRNWGSTYPVNDIQAPLYVVADSKASNGIGGLRTISYKYEGLKVHLRGRGLLGFKQQTVTDQATGSRTVTRYRQDFPYVGAPDLVTLQTASGVTISQTATDWDAKTLGSAGSLRYFAFPRDVTARQYEIDAMNSLVSSTVTHLDYNESLASFCGNASRSTVSVYAGNVNSSIPYVTVSDNTYKPEGGQCLGRLETATTTRTTPDDPTGIARSSSFEYDAITGLLAAETVEPNDANLWLRKDYTRDAYGNIRITTISGADIATRATTITFDTRGQFPLDITNALGHIERRTYDSATGNVLTFRNSNDLFTSLPTVSWQYDVFGRVTRVTNRTGTYTTTARQWCGGSCGVSYAQFAVTNSGSDGSTSKIIFDVLEREIAKQQIGFDGSWIRQLTEYNAKGQVARQSVPQFSTQSTFWTAYTYDDMGRVKVENAPFNENVTSGRLTTFDYAGLTVHQVDPLYRDTWRTINVLGKVIEVKDDSLNTTRYSYDAFENVTAVRDALGNEVTMGYDVRGRKTSMNDPDMKNWTYDYDALGELLSQTDAKQQTVQMEYDVLGRITKRTEPDAETTWSYDTARKGALTSVKQKTSAAGSTVYERTHAYDTYGRISSASYYIPPQTSTLRYSYDSQSRLYETTYPTGFKVRNLYNSRGYPSEVRDAATNALYWRGDAQDARGNWTFATQGNGTETMRSHDAANGRLMAIVTTAAGQPAVQSLNYTWDNLGNLSERVDQLQGGLQERFQYDNLNRLTNAKVYPVSGNATLAQTDITLTYNAIGNIVSKSDIGSYTYGSSRPHAVTSTGNGVTYSYDANGNLLSGNSRTLGWTSSNLPSSVSRGQDRTDFVYGPERQRVLQVTTASGVTTTITYVDGLFERHQIGSLTKNVHYVVAPGGVTGIYTQIVGAKAELVTSTHYVHRDHRDSVDAITDENGLVIDRMAFDAFGKRRALNWLNVAAPSQLPHDTRYGYTGHEHLDAVEFIHMGGRVYDPGLARFTSADPTVQFPENTQGLNRYTYVGNNPFTYTDPSGFAWNRINTELKRWEGDTRKEIRNPDSQAGPALHVLNAFAATSCGKYAALCAGAGEFLISKWQGVSTADSTRAAGTAVFAAVVSSGIGGELAKSGASTTSIMVASVVTHGVVGGITTVVNGGEFAEGFLSAGFTTLFAPNVQAWSGGNQLLGIVMSAAVGGTAAELGGGKFANGAVTGAYFYALRSVAREMQNGASFGDAIGKLWALPNTVLGLAYGSLGYGIGWAGYSLGIRDSAPGITFGYNAIQFTNNPLMVSAMTFGNTIVYGSGPQFQPTAPRYYDHWLGTEEMQHTFQAQALGPFYLPAHAIFGMAALLVNGWDWHGSANILESGPHSDIPYPW